MKLPCKTVEDLLPLYHDRVCSQESRTLVEDHLVGCESCQKFLTDLDAAEPTAAVDDAAPLKALKKEWDRTLVKSYIKGIAVACLVCALLFGAGYLLTQWRCVPVSPDVLEITNVSQLESGPIVFHMFINDDRNLRMIGSTVTEDGALYYTPMHAILEGNSDRRLDENFGFFNSNHMIDLEWFRGNGDPEITSVYVGPVGNGILIWEKGTELPPASQDLEDEFAEIHRVQTEALHEATRPATE